MLWELLCVLYLCSSWNLEAFPPLSWRGITAELSSPSMIFCMPPVKACNKQKHSEEKSLNEPHNAQRIFSDWTGHPRCNSFLQHSFLFVAVLFSFSPLILLQGLSHKPHAVSKSLCQQAFPGSFVPFSSGQNYLCRPLFCKNLHSSMLFLSYSTVWRDAGSVVCFRQDGLREPYLNICTYVESSSVWAQERERIAQLVQIYIQHHLFSWEINSLTMKKQYFRWLLLLLKKNIMKLPSEWELSSWKEAQLTPWTTNPLCHFFTYCIRSPLRPRANKHEKQQGMAAAAACPLAFLGPGQGLDWLVAQLS